MSDSATVFDAALDLSEDQRASLALRLIESLDGGPDDDVEEAWRQEIARRVEELRSGAATTVPSSEVRRRVLGRLASIRG